MNYRKLPLYLLGLTILASLFLSACGAAPMPTDKVLAPIQYDTVSMPGMTYASVVNEEKVTTHMLYPSLQLLEDQIAVCKLPGIEPQYEIVKVEGPNPYPSKYCRTYEGKEQVYVTMHDVANECPGAPNGVESALCRDEISRLRLQDNATATGNIKINFYHVIDNDTKKMHYELGYDNIMYEFNRTIKDGIRGYVKGKNIALIDFDGNQLASEIAEYVKSGDIFDNATESQYKEVLKKAFRIVSFEFTYLEPDGLNNEAAAQNNQEIQDAGAIATQWAVACSAYQQGSSQRLVCECNYACAKSGQSCSCSAGINPVFLTEVPTITPEVITTPTP